MTKIDDKYNNDYAIEFSVDGSELRSMVRKGGIPTVLEAMRRICFDAEQNLFNAGCDYNNDFSIIRWRNQRRKLEKFIQDW